MSADASEARGRGSLGSWNDRGHVSLPLLPCSLGQNKLLHFKCSKLGILDLKTNTLWTFSLSEGWISQCVLIIRRIDGSGSVRPNVQAVVLIKAGCSEVLCEHLLLWQVLTGKEAGPG